MSARRNRKSWRRLPPAVGFALLIAGVIGYGLFEQSRSRAALVEVQKRLARRDYASAQPLLAWLASRRPSDGETWFQLGLCERELGHNEAARKAWDSVPPGSPFAGRAAVKRARQELTHDRFADAEALLTRALDDRGTHATEAFETLVHLFKIQGRFREARRLVRLSWDRYPDAIGVLKELAQIDSLNPYPITRARELLERAEQTAAGDDRVWLGLANLESRSGNLGAADQWLRRCEEKRPHDAAVVRSRLTYAMACDDTPAALRTLKRLPSDSLDPDEILRLRAWFGERMLDSAAERHALSSLLELTPSDPRALERLIELEYRAGEHASAGHLRARKAQLDKAKPEYEYVLFLPDASTQAARLASLAETLQRPLEARILWKVELALRPGDRRAIEGLARAEAIVPPLVPAGATLPALLADLDRARPDLLKTRTVTVSESPPIPRFEDDAPSAGIDFSFNNGLEPLHHLPETTSGGVGLLDFDGDGWLDVYLVQGGPFPPDPRAPGGDRLFRNRGNGRFEDVTVKSRISSLKGGYGHGVTVGDFDNDGHPDLFVTRWRRYALYRNRGDGTFEDVTDSAGLSGDRDFPTSAAFADLDGDGDLDLYVCHYGVWDSEHPALCARKSGPDRYEYCDPRNVPPLPDHLFRNDGGHFTDVTKDAGIVDLNGRGLGVIAADLDEDGKLDLFVANDTTANYLFHNLGTMRFEEVGHIAGVASNANGGYQAGMGVACGDLNGDGRLDIAVTNFINESMTYYENLGEGLFADSTTFIGLAAATKNSLGFGTTFLDANNDGHLDLAVTNGHVNDLRPEFPLKMPSQLFLGSPSGRLVNVSGQAGSPWQVPRLGRGLAAGDLDNDGRVDLMVLSQNQPVAFFHNKTVTGHSLTLRLEGVRSNRDAVGARVFVEAEGRRLVRYRSGGGSFQSASDQRLHFGLGRASVAELVEIHWPSGTVDRFQNLSADKGYLIREGNANPQRLQGF